MGKTKEKEIKVMENINVAYFSSYYYLSTICGVRE